MVYTSCGATITCKVCNTSYILKNKRRINLHNKKCDSFKNYDVLNIQRPIHIINNENNFHINDITTMIAGENYLRKCSRCKASLCIDNFHQNRVGEYYKMCNSCLDTQSRINKRNKN